MEDLEKKVREILTVYLREELGNRVSQFSVKGLTDILLGEIANYKPGENKNAVNTCRPIIKETVKENKK